jgi:cold shock protein
VVTSVLNVDSSAAKTSSRAGSGFDRRAPGPSTVLEGAVKRFDAEKGYGFISPDGGGKDVFIHITALRRSGVTALDAGQRVRVEVVDGRKGLEAERITLI